MVRIVSVISPRSDWIGTRPYNDSAEVEFDSNLEPRVSLVSGGYPVRLYSRSPKTEEVRPPALRCRILVGSSAIQDELDHMNQFLIAKAVGGGEFVRVSPGTIEQHALGLRRYAEWLMEYWYPASQENHYLNFRSPHQAKRPTYAYRDFVVDLPQLSPSTKDTHVRIVRAFYEHLERRAVIAGLDARNYQKKRSQYICSSSSKGVAIRKSVQVSDLHIPHSKSESVSVLRNVVVDGGIVRPLIDAELKITLDVLRKTDNPTLRLASYLALNSGARLQTVLTLRRSHAQQILACVHDNVSHAAVSVGGLHPAQAKASREYVLQVPTRPDAMVVPCQDVLNRPTSVGHLLGEFEASPFARKRYATAKAIRTSKGFPDVGDNEYLFLGRNGMPFYLHSNDPLNLLRKSARRGEAFKDTFSTQLAAKVVDAANESGCAELAAAGLGFHDFRGTFAEQNLLRTIAVCTESGMDRVQAEQVALHQTQHLLGHSNIESTQRYLQFRGERTRLLEANERYARSLAG